MFDENFILAVFLGFLATYGARILPFLLFKNKTNNTNLAFIQKNIPLVIMVVLVFYCFFMLDFSSFSSGAKALISCLFVFVLHWCFKNVLLSIFLGTLFYMLLLRIF